MDNKSYRPGEWWAVCDICGLDKYASQLGEDYRGFRVCRDTCLDKRNSQEFVRARPEKIVVAWTRVADSEGAIETTSSDISPIDLSVPDLDTLTFFIEALSGGMSVHIPVPNSSSWLGIGVVLTIVNVGSNSFTITTLSGATRIQGDRTIEAGETAKFRNIPSQNLWIRES